MQGIFGSFSALLRQIDTAGVADEPVVFAAWKRCVDGALAEHVVPLRLEGNRLIAAVSNETWRRNVADLGPELVSRINVLLGSSVVRFIEFQVNSAVIREHRHGLRPDRGSTHDDAAIARQVTPGLQVSAGSITDDALRQQFLAAAAASLARRERNGETGS